MAYIAPQGDIYILKNVPFDRSYNHTVKWSSATAQFDTLSVAPFFKYHLEEQSYQRWKRDYIRVSLTCDDLYDCNYLIFRNKGYSDKWFYAFLDEPEYINNNCSAIHYTIDVMQTWMFDIEVPPCFVEREHALTDTIGSNLIEENLETGELQTYFSEEYNFYRMLGAIITSKPIAGSFTVNPTGQTVASTYSVITQITPSKAITATRYGAANGIPNGLYIAYGFPVTDEDIENYWDVNNTYLLFDMQDYKAAFNTFYGNLTIGRLLEYIGSGYVPCNTLWGGTLSIDDVVAVYLYPAELNRTSNINNAEGSPNYFKKGTAIMSFNIGNRPKYFYFSDQTTHYTPNNNKLFTFPYIQLFVSNNLGDNVIYRYEEIGKTFSNQNTRCLFECIGTFANKPMVSLVPQSYKRVARNWEYSLNISDFPTPTYKGEQFAKYLESNSAKLNFGVLSSVVGSLANIGMGISAPMPPQLAKRATAEHHAEYSNNDIPMAYNRTASAVSGGLNIANEIGSSLAKIHDLKNAPPSVYGTYNNDVMNITTNRLGFKFYSMAIRGEFAQQIDDYFSMFGYATKRVKVPNVFSSNTTHRKNWNYLNTKGALVKSKTDTSGVPAFDLEQIQNILDKGITFWNSISNVGNYNLDNSIVTQ